MRIEQKEMLSTFNCGVGMVLSLQEAEVNTALDLLDKLAIHSKIIGTVEQKKTEEASLDITLD